jgi:hypothetical protein
LPKPWQPSHRQIEANRRNALASTGPKSEDGKSRSRANAIKHGLTAESLMLADEDPRVFDDLRARIFAEYTPGGAFEEQLVERALSLLWRLRRVPAFEVALFRWQQNVLAKEYSGIFARDKRALDTNDPALDVLETGRTLEALLKSSLFDRLSRYETTLHRQLSQTTKELHEMQSVRLSRSNDATAVEFKSELEMVDVAQNDTSQLPA